MIKCPFCAEEIQDEAIKCRFCHEFLDPSRQPDQSKPKWYFTTSCVVIALLTVGPLGLPLVWWHPHYKPVTKILVSVAVIAVSIWSYYLVKDAYQMLMNQLKGLGIQ